MGKTFRGAMIGGFRRSDVVRYLESLDARQRDDLRRRELETEEARRQADAAYAELNAAREAAANLRAALAAERSENARLSQRAGQLEQQQSALRDSLRAAGDEHRDLAAGGAEVGSQLSRLCDRLDDALARLDELMRDGSRDETPAPPDGDEPSAVPPTPAHDPAPEPVHKSTVSDLLARVRPR